MLVQVFLLLEWVETLALACVEHFHSELHPCGELNNTLGIYIITYTCTVEPMMTTFFVKCFFFF